MAQLQIALPNAVFLPNQKVNAFVYVTTERMIKARRISVKISGFAKDEWIAGMVNGCPIVYGTRRNIYIGFFLLWESKDGSNTFPAGQHKLPFNFKVPADAPPSLELKCGSVKYKIEACIEVPWNLNIEEELELQIESFVDLNADSRLSESISGNVTEMESSCCCSCKSYPITLKASLPKKGFAVEECVPISFEIINESQTAVTLVEYGLTAHEKYFAGGGFGTTTHYDRDINVLTFTAPINSTSNVSQNCKLRLSNVYPSLKYEIIHISYSIFVKVHTDSTFSSGPGVTFPIVIGTVPIVTQESSSTPICSAE